MWNHGNLRWADSPAMFNELNGRHAEVDPACGVDPERVVEGPRAARSLDPLRPFIVGWKSHTTRVLK